MIQRLRFTGTAAMVLALVFGLSRCKQPQTPMESTTAVTTEQKVDTTAAELIKKTVVIPDTAVVVRQVPLTLVITNLASPTAPVIVGLYGLKNKFPDPKDELKEYKFNAKGDTLKVKIADRNFGTYALAIYQDVNSNGKIDKNMIGIPTEPYAFSNNYKPTVKAPNFNNCKFEYSAESNTVSMKFIR